MGGPTWLEGQSSCSSPPATFRLMQGWLPREPASKCAAAAGDGSASYAFVFPQPDAESLRALVRPSAPGQLPAGRCCTSVASCATRSACGA